MSTKNKKTPKLNIRKDDTVIVLSGNDKGKKGKVLEVFPSKGTVIVEGVRVVTKHKKPSASNPEGGIEHTENPISVSKLMLIDPASGKPTRVGRKLNDQGKLQRYSKKTGEFISNG